MKNKLGIMEEALKRDESFNRIRDKVDAALTRNIRAGVDMDCDGDGDQDCNDYAWVQDLYPTIVVYSMNGFLYQADYSIDANNVTFGTPKKVEVTYSAVGESARFLVANVEQLKESAYDAAAGEFPIKIIQPGMSKNNRFYPAEVLKRDFNIFEGAKMFADHQTDAQSKAQPEGSVHNWVATLKGVYAESDGTLRGKAVVIDPAFKAKLATLAEKNLLTEMGISIRAVGAGSKRTIDDVQATYVESLVACRSVDFVTFAGAGGQVLTESATSEFDVDLVTEAQLRSRRPDLIALIESTNKENTMQKTLEQQLQEARTRIAELETSETSLKGKLQEAEKAVQRTAAQSALTNLLKESKLPEVSKTRIQTQFKEAVNTDGMKEAITAEEAYVKQLGSGGTSRKNMGAADNIQESEGAKQATPQELFESYKLIMPEAEAKIAAGI
jgi:hypothetical protein